jgi:hypothetical protein
VALVVTPRRGALTEVRLACLLAHMKVTDRTDYDVLGWTLKQRLDSALLLADRTLLATVIAHAAPYIRHRYVYNTGTSPNFPKEDVQAIFLITLDGLLANVRNYHRSRLYRLPLLRGQREAEAFTCFKRTAQHDAYHRRNSWTVHRGNIHRNARR